MSGQGHGKEFENLLKTHLFIGAAEEADEWTAKIDIAARFDARLHLGTSVKASKNGGVIWLSDAGRFWRSQGPFRLMVGCWRQVTREEKEFYEVHEFILGGEMLLRLWGNVTLEQVQSFHEGLSAFPEGTHQAARAWARQEKARLPSPGEGVTLNPKIDSGTQRRLQCSLKLAALTALAARFPQAAPPGAPSHAVHRSQVGSLAIPFRLTGGSRQFRP